MACFFFIVTEAMRLRKFAKSGGSCERRQLLWNYFAVSLTTLEGAELPQTFSATATT